MSRAQTVILVPPAIAFTPGPTPAAFSAAFRILGARPAGRRAAAAAARKDRD